MSISAQEPETPNLDQVFQPTADERARQNFVSVLRNMAKTDMSEIVAQRYADEVLPKFVRQSGTEPQSGREIEKLMKPTLEYKIYSSFRYNAQEMTYQSVIDPIERHFDDAIAAANKIAEQNPAGGSLTLNPDMEIPTYVKALDIHLVPGCFYSEYAENDVAQGMILAEGGKVATGANPHRRNDGGGVAKSVSNWLKRQYPDFKPRRVADLGTQSGKNLLPYVDAFPGIEAYGIDVSAPALRYGHAQAETAGKRIHFVQRNAEELGFDDGYFDLIVSSFFFHEVPLDSTRRILKECYRALSPGGMMVHMELPPHAACDPWSNFAWDWDTKNNNEPHYTRFRSQDPAALCTVAGFDESSCFGLTIPGHTTFSDQDYQRFLNGELTAPRHGRGGWFVFGAIKNT